MTKAPLAIRATFAFAIALVTCCCSLDRAGVAAAVCTDSSSCAFSEACVDGRCVLVRDGGELDASSDAGADASLDAAPTDTGVDGPLDAGTSHCVNGITDADESDRDCGGSCGPCGSCDVCLRASDCVGECIGGRCAVELSMVSTPSGTSIPAFVRGGAVLLAHYAPGTFHRGYNPHTAQQMDSSGGTTPLPDWAPDPCHESGHLDFRSVTPDAREIRLECGPEIGRPTLSISSTIFDSFDMGDYGTFGATGSPGWGNISAIGSGRGRTSYGSCGSGLSASTGGIAYCDGSSATLSSHLISYTVFTGGGNPYVGCGRIGCNGPSCSTHVWVWADLP